MQIYAQEITQNFESVAKFVIFLVIGKKCLRDYRRVNLS